MKFTEYDQLIEHRKAGDIVYTAAYEWGVRNRLPIQGILAAGHTDGKNRDLAARGKTIPYYFIPFKDGTAGEPDWRNSVSLASGVYADTEQEINELYNRLVRESAKRLREQIAECEKDLIPTLDQTRNDDGELETQPVWKADLSADCDAILSEMKQDMTLLPDDQIQIKYREMSWETFRELARYDRITDHDGMASLHVDGTASSNVLIVLWMESVMVGDTYLIPFDRIPEIFAGHEIKILWFPN